jgi:hypothetical protein
MINYAKNLKFEEKPDYKLIKSYLAKARQSNSLQFDWVYDWTIKK